MSSVPFFYSLLALRLGGDALTNANNRPIPILNAVFIYTTHVHIVKGEGGSPKTN